MQDCCPACFIAISPGFFFGVWFRDRSFCDHFYSVMICRLAFEAIIRVFRGVCRPEGRMVDALADSTDEGRLRMR